MNPLVKPMLLHAQTVVHVPPVKLALVVFVLMVAHGLRMHVVNSRVREHVQPAALGQHRKVAIVLSETIIPLAWRIIFPTTEPHAPIHRAVVPASGIHVIAVEAT